MTKKLDLRTKKKAPAASQMQQLPLPTGAAIRWDDLTPQEKKQLDAMGIKEQQVLPGNLAEIIQAAKDSVENAVGHLPVPPDTPPLKVNVNDISELDPEAQKAVLRSIEQVKEANKRKEAYHTIADAAPGVNEAIQKASSVPLEVMVVDDREEQAEKSKPQHEDDTSTDSVSDAHGISGGSDKLEVCPHCNFNLTFKEIVEVTDDDKRRYIAAVLTEKRFKKSYELLGGRMVVTFKSLLTSEVEKIYVQLRIDSKRDSSFNAFWLDQLRQYRFALSLDSITTVGVGRIEIPELKDVQIDEDSEDTALPALTQWVADEAVTLETIRRKLDAKFAEFQRLQEKLEANLDNSDFWLGIE